MAAKFHLMSFYTIRKGSNYYGHILYEQNFFFFFFLITKLVWQLWREYGTEGRAQFFWAFPSAVKILGW